MSTEDWQALFSLILTKLRRQLVVLLLYVFSPSAPAFPPSLWHTHGELLQMLPVMMQTRAHTIIRDGSGARRN